MSDVSFHDLSALDVRSRAALLRRSETDLSGFMETVKPIIEAVRVEGDAALVRYARELDKADLDESRLKATEAEFDAAFDLVEEKSSQPSGSASTISGDSTKCRNQNRCG
jgi:histidinol dehydrogenase